MTPGAAVWYRATLGTITGVVEGVDGDHVRIRVEGAAGGLRVLRRFVRVGVPS